MLEFQVSSGIQIACLNQFYYLYTELYLVQLHEEVLNYGTAGTIKLSKKKKPKD